MLRKLKMSEKIFYIIIGFLVILLSLLLFAAYSSGGKDINTFLVRLSYYTKHLEEIFAYAFDINYVIFLWICLFIYVCIILISLLKPDKYLRGREYGSAEWGDVNKINDLISSKTPEEKYKMYYIPEAKGRKFVRKIFERKKKYIK